MKLLTAVAPILFAFPVLALDQPQTLHPSGFIQNYLQQSQTTQRAQRDKASAENLKTQRQDQWQSRLSVTPEISFEQQSFESGARPDNSNRTSNITGSLSQQLPTGIQVDISAQKFLETQNPLFSALDRSHSVKISQDLFKNAFGKSQNALSELGNTDFKVAELNFKLSIAKTCLEAFNLYTDAYIQQESFNILKEQYQDAKKAHLISKNMFKNKLISRLQQLTSENDFINTQWEMQLEQQKLDNLKRELLVYLNSNDHNLELLSPETYLNHTSQDLAEGPTLAEVIIKKQIESQNLVVERSRSERRTDMQLSVEAGERFGRLAFNGPLINYNEEYLKASVTMGFDLINNTENSDLKTSLYQKNSLIKEQLAIENSQKAKVLNYRSMDATLRNQIKQSRQQVKLLKEKMKLARKRMNKAQMDFQDYLFHRNAYFNQRKRLLSNQKDLWINQLSLLIEYSQHYPKLCEGVS